MAAASRARPLTPASGSSGDGAATPVATHTAPEGRPAVGRIVALVVKERGGGERLVHLTEEPVLVGRDAGCGLRLESPFVCREHARIEQQPAGTALVDLDSHNGCFVSDSSAPHQSCESRRS